MGAPQKQKPRWASPRVVVGAFGAVFAVALLANYRSNSSGGAQGWSLSSAPAASAQSTAAPTTTLTDVEIHRRCAKYKVPEPPQYRPEKVAEAEAMVKLLRHKGGVYKLMGNKTFMKAMATFTLEERERMALEAHTVVLHLQKEALTLIAQEEKAALRAAPNGDLYKLNGLNVGVGGRMVHPSLIGVDAHRGRPEGAGSQVPAYQSTAGNTLLAWADQLPFRSNSIDYIVSLQNMEHLHDPVATVLHYMDILKPGGGLGVGLPNWRYAWDARNEITAWGHRWNTAPEVVCYLYHKYWSHVCDLEQLNTMTYRLTFDFVLRKKGKWEPFPQEFPTYPTGRELFCAGKFIGPPNMPPTVNNDTLGPCATPTPDVFI